MHIYPVPAEGQERPIDVQAKAVLDEVGDWIDTACIAELVFEAIRDQYNILPTVEQCREVWLRILDQLGEDVSRCVAWMHDELDPANQDNSDANRALL